MLGIHKYAWFKFENYQLQVSYFVTEKLLHTSERTHICRHAREPYVGDHPTVYNRESEVHKNRPSAPAQHTAYICSVPAGTKEAAEAAEHTRYTDTRENQRYRTASPTAGHQRTRVRPRKDDRNVKY